MGRLAATRVRIAFLAVEVRTPRLYRKRRSIRSCAERLAGLKVLKPALLADGDQGVRDLFARFVQSVPEHEPAWRFHPLPIATVMDLGEADGRYFMAMRYVEGVSLDQLILSSAGDCPARRR